MTQYTGVNNGVKDVFCVVSVADINRVTTLVRTGREYPCGGGVEYLHCDSARRRRRRKGKSQISDSKIWSQDQRASDPRRTALPRAYEIVIMLSVSVCPQYQHISLSKGYHLDVVGRPSIPHVLESDAGGSLSSW
jgi:hypothetical protein